MAEAQPSGADRSVAVATVGAIVGGLAFGGLAWWVMPLFLDLPDAEGILDGMFVALAGLVVLGYVTAGAWVAGTVVGTGIALAVTRSSQIALTVALVLVADVIAVPLAVALLLAAPDEISTALLLTVAAALTGAVPAALGRMMALRASA